jgi:hypothetical protein
MRSRWEDLGRVFLRRHCIWWTHSKGQSKPEDLGSTIHSFHPTQPPSVMTPRAIRGYPTSSPPALVAVAAIPHLLLPVVDSQLDHPPHQPLQGKASSPVETEENESPRGKRYLPIEKSWSSSLSSSACFTPSFNRTHIPVECRSKTSAFSRRKEHQGESDFPC